ncbi:hypothetical protein [Acidovorax sp. SRB_14]|uniref:hypothetical protein n=1 Tax=Acidovorax sp. SRB_14 TaxID=1962699 RepID=UPI0020B133B6|nr:hypothetical protein [Acidovorax sp. SRB_14]
MVLRLHLGDFRRQPSHGRQVAQLPSPLKPAHFHLRASQLYLAGIKNPFLSAAIESIICANSWISRQKTSRLRCPLLQRPMTAEQEHGVPSRIGICLFIGGTINKMKIELDSTKREKTLAHCGLDFARAAEVFVGLHFTGRTPGKTMKKTASSPRASWMSAWWSWS